MLGLLNVGLQRFVNEVHGVDKWQAACEHAELPFYSFEAMLDYDDHVTEKLTQGICSVLKRPVEEILEDFGTYTVANKDSDTVRYLLRLGGDSFSGFLQSLEDVRDRTKLVLPNAYLPQLLIEALAPDHFVVTCPKTTMGFRDFLIGVLRAMADDYGALAMIEVRDPTDIETFCLDITVFDEHWGMSALEGAA